MHVSFFLIHVRQQDTSVLTELRRSAEQLLCRAARTSWFVDVPRSPWQCTTGLPQDDFLSTILANEDGFWSNKCSRHHVALITNKSLHCIGLIVAFQKSTILLIPPCTAPPQPSACCIFLFFSSPLHARQSFQFQRWGLISNHLTLHLRTWTNNVDQK